MKQSTRPGVPTLSAVLPDVSHALPPVLSLSLASGAGQRRVARSADTLPHRVCSVRQKDYTHITYFCFELISIEHDITVALK